MRRPPPPHRPGRSARARAGAGAAVLAVAAAVGCAVPSEPGATPAPVVDDRTPGILPAPDGAASPGTTAAPVPDGPPGLLPAPPAGFAATGPPVDPAVFEATDTAMAQRVRQAGLRGGYLLIARPGQVLYEKAYGGVGRTTPLAVASTSKWLASALVLTYVDEGKLALDEPISRWLPQFSGPKAGITLRQLLNHTSGIKQQPCIFDTSGVLATCVDRLAAGPLEFAPGTQFAYGNGSYHVAARLAEVAGGGEFIRLFDERIGRPLGLTGSTWNGGATRNPSPAAGVRTTVEDESRFLRMLLADGAFEGRRILSPDMAAELQRNQVAGYSTAHDYAVGITRIPTYSLGAWRDVADGEDRTAVISGNGATGFYPWIDRRNGTYGIVGVEDQRGAEVAVPASKKVVDVALAATAGIPSG